LRVTRPLGADGAPIVHSVPLAEGAGVKGLVGTELPGAVDGSDAVAPAGEAG